MKRRRFLALAFAPLPAALAAGAAPVLALAARLPVPGPDLAGCLLPWREGLPVVHWDAEIAEGCYGWAQQLAREEEHRRVGEPLRHSLAWPAQECVAAHIQDWSKTFTAWTNSPPHLEVLRHTRATRVGMAGYGDHRGLFWVLRVK